MGVRRGEPLWSIPFNEEQGYTLQLPRILRGNFLLLSLSHAANHSPRATACRAREGDQKGSPLRTLPTLIGKNHNRL